MHIARVGPKCVHFCCLSLLILSFTDDDWLLAGYAQMQVEEMIEKRASCDRCLRPLPVCICEALPAERLHIDTKIIVVQHPCEVRKQNIGTGKSLFIRHLFNAGSERVRMTRMFMSVTRSWLGITFADQNR